MMIIQTWEKTYKKIHDEDGHEDDEDNNDEVRGDGVEHQTCEVFRWVRVIQVVKVVKDTTIVDLSSHHCHGFAEWVSQGVERYLQKYWEFKIWIRFPFYFLRRRLILLINTEWKG